MLDLVSLLTGHYPVITGVFILNIIVTIISNYYSPWMVKNSLFSYTIPLFNILFCGMLDIFTSIEAAFYMKIDLAIIFITLVMSIGVFLTKLIVSEFSEKNAPKPRILKYFFELSCENIIFYLATLLSWLLLPMIDYIVSNINEYGAIVVISIIMLTIIFTVPAAVYIICMSFTLYIFFQILCSCEQNSGKIITTFLALLTSAILDTVLTDIMIMIPEKIVLNRLPYQIREKIKYPRRRNRR